MHFFKHKNNYEWIFIAITSKNSISVRTLQHAQSQSTSILPLLALESGRQRTFLFFPENVTHPVQTSLPLNIVLKVKLSFFILPCFHFSDYVKSFNKKNLLLPGKFTFTSLQICTLHIRLGQFVSKILNWKICSLW